MEARHGLNAAWPCCTMCYRSSVPAALRLGPSARGELSEGQRVGQWGGAAPGACAGLGCSAGWGTWGRRFWCCIQSHLSAQPVLVKARGRGRRCVWSPGCALCPAAPVNLGSCLWLGRGAGLGPAQAGLVTGCGGLSPAGCLALAAGRGGDYEGFAWGCHVEARQHLPCLRLPSGLQASACCARTPSSASSPSSAPPTTTWHASRA